MAIRFCQREGTTDEGDLSMIAEVRRNEAVAVMKRDLAVTAEVDTAKPDFPSGEVDEPVALNTNPRHRHRRPILSLP